MTITRERFAQGLTYDQFKAVLTRSKASFEASERSVQLHDADLIPFRDLPAKLDVLVLVTETCPDVIMNVPILERIAQESGKLNLRIFLRDDHTDIMASYMNGPYESVPVFVFLDPDWTELGVWIERPKAVTELRERLTREIYASNPEFGSSDAPPSDLPEEIRGRLQQAIRQMREDSGRDYARLSIRDLGEMVKGFASRTRLSGPVWRGNLAAVAV